jgi:uncharacterized protein (TIGR00369 family)
MSDFRDVLGLRPVDAGDLDAGMALTVEDRHLNQHGTVHGGVVATLVDSVMGEAVRGSLDEGRAAVTVSMTVSYLAPADVGDQLRARAELRKGGGRIIVAEADVFRDTDQLAVAHAVATFSSVAAEG